MKLIKKYQFGGNAPKYISSSSMIPRRNKPSVLSAGQRYMDNAINKAIPQQPSSFSDIPNKLLGTTGVDKRTNWDNVKRIYDVASKNGLNKYQTAAVLANIIHESFGNPMQQQIGAKAGVGSGLLQNTPERFTDMISKINPADVVAQTKYILDSTRVGNGKTDWHARGRYKTWTEARDEFNKTLDSDPKALEKYVYSFTAGYVGPKDLDGQYNARLNTAKQLLAFME